MLLIPVSSRRFLRVAVVGALLAAGVTSAAVSQTAASGGDSVEFRMRDDCDVDSFNEFVGPDTCVGDGDTTFEEFLAALPSGGDSKWRFQPESTEVKRGANVKVVNRGGEGHTFTEVFNFGVGGLVDILDTSQPPGTPQAIPVDGFENLEFLLPGSVTNLGVLAPGTHLFQCMIHPWMRSTVVVRNR